MYLNIYDFGYYGDGIKSASIYIFQKELSILKIEESAILIGMLQNSSLYDPLRRPEITKNRRDLVLMQMAKKYISENEKGFSSKIPLKLNYTLQSHRQGLATYFRSYLRGFMKDWTDNNLKSDGSKYNLYSDGLKIYTTINSKMQSMLRNQLQSI